MSTCLTFPLIKDLYEALLWNYRYAFYDFFAFYATVAVSCQTIQHVAVEGSNNWYVHSAFLPCDTKGNL